MSDPAESHSLSSAFWMAALLPEDAVEFMPRAALAAALHIYSSTSSSSCVGHTLARPISFFDKCAWPWALPLSLGMRLISDPLFGPPSFLRSRSSWRTIFTRPWHLLSRSKRSFPCKAYFWMPLPILIRSIGMPWVMPQLLFFALRLASTPTLSGRACPSCPRGGNAWRGRPSPTRKAT